MSLQIVPHVFSKETKQKWTEISVISGCPRWHSWSIQIITNSVVGLVAYICCGRIISVSADSWTKPNVGAFWGERKSLKILNLTLTKPETFSYRNITIKLVFIVCMFHFDWQAPLLDNIRLGFQARMNWHDGTRGRKVPESVFVTGLEQEKRFCYRLAPVTLTDGLFVCCHIRTGSRCPPVTH